MELKNAFIVLALLALGAMFVYYIIRHGISGLFNAIGETVNGGENAVIDSISAITPYLVPIIPAYLTYYHVGDPRAMNFPNEIAWTAAIVVEFLGMSSMATTIRFWRNNQRYSSEKNKAPFWLALATYVFYLAITLTVNVILENELGDRNSVVIWAIGLFSTLSVPSGVLIAVRSLYREMLDERTSSKPKSKNGKPQTTNESDEKPPREQKQRPASTFAPQIMALLDAEYSKNQRVLSPREITPKLKGLTQTHDKAKGKISEITKEWKAQRGISDNSAPPDKFTI